jgi:hypothetical protein
MVTRVYSLDGHMRVEAISAFTAAAAGRDATNPPATARQNDTRTLRQESRSG